jgi:hypothetical protein
MTYRHAQSGTTISGRSAWLTLYDNASGRGAVELKLKSGKVSRIGSAIRADSRPRSTPACVNKKAAYSSR